MRIGFSGHRPNRLRIPVVRLRVRLREALDHLVSKAATASPDVAISPLAEGADRLFAAVALEAGLTLEALLPMPADDYVHTFESPATTPVFHELLARARRVRQLPGSLADTSAAYAALGRELIATSDVLVAVWDGKPAAGRGGTPEVIAHALAGGRPVVWIDATVDRPPQRLRSVTPDIDAAPMTD